MSIAHLKINAMTVSNTDPVYSNGDYIEIIKSYLLLI